MSQKTGIQPRFCQPNAEIASRHRLPKTNRGCRSATSSRATSGHFRIHIHYTSKPNSPYNLAACANHRKNMQRSIRGHQELHSMSLPLWSHISSNTSSSSSMEFPKLQSSANFIRTCFSCFFPPWCSPSSNHVISIAFLRFV